MSASTLSATPRVTLPCKSYVTTIGIFAPTTSRTARTTCPSGSTRPTTHLELRARHLQARRHRGSATVGGVRPRRLHVVREARRAADAGDEHDVLSRHAHLRHEPLNGREDRVVAAAGAPTHVVLRLRRLRD